MGIEGLLQRLAPLVQMKASVGDLPRGSVVAVDASGWLHKGAYSCAKELALGEPTTKYLHFIRAMAKALLDRDLRPLFVLDGNRPDLKGETNAERRSAREEARERGLELHRAVGAAEKKLTTARRHRASPEELARLDGECKRLCVERDKMFGRSAGVTTEMITALVRDLSAAKIDFLVAPFEADAQLAMLCRLGIAQAVVTEDSDVLVHLTIVGATATVFLKMKPDGTADRIDIHPGGPRAWAAKLFRAPPTEAASASRRRPDAFSAALRDMDEDHFLDMCILSGCDYLKSLPRVGIVSAAKHIAHHAREPSAARVARLVDAVRKRVDDKRKEVKAAAAAAAARAAPEREHEEVREEEGEEGEEEDGGGGGVKEEEEEDWAMLELIAEEEAKGEDEIAKFLDGYVERFVWARLCFQHHVVYDPVERRARHLTDLRGSDAEQSVVRDVLAKIFGAALDAGVVQDIAGYRRQSRPPYTLIGAAPATFSSASTGSRLVTLGVELTALQPLIPPTLPNAHSSSSTFTRLPAMTPIHATTRTLPSSHFGLAAPTSASTTSSHMSSPVSLSSPARRLREESGLRTALWTTSAESAGSAASASAAGGAAGAAGAASGGALRGVLEDDDDVIMLVSSQEDVVGTGARSALRARDEDDDMSSSVVQSPLEPSEKRARTAVMALSPLRRSLFHSPVQPPTSDLARVLGHVRPHSTTATASAAAAAAAAAAPRHHVLPATTTAPGPKRTLPSYIASQGGGRPTKPPSSAASGASGGGRTLPSFFLSGGKAKKT